LFSINLHREPVSLQLLIPLAINIAGQDGPNHQMSTSKLSLSLYTKASDKFASIY